VNAVDLNVFRGNFEDALHGLFGVDHFRHQLEKGSIVPYLIHGKGGGGGPFC
jgi:hypothetical protein